MATNLITESFVTCKGVETGLCRANDGLPEAHGGNLIK